MWVLGQCPFTDKNEPVGERGGLYDSWPEQNQKDPKGATRGSVLLLVLQIAASLCFGLCVGLAVCDRIQPVLFPTALLIGILPHATFPGLQ